MSIEDTIKTRSMTDWNKNETFTWLLGQLLAITKRNLRKFSKTNRLVALISLVLGAAGVWTLYNLLKNNPDRSLFFTVHDGRFIGTIGLILILGTGLIRNFYNLFWGNENRIVSGVGLRGTPYEFTKLIDRRCREILFTGHNLHDLLTREDFKDLIIKRLKGRFKPTIRIICAT